MQCHGCCIVVSGSEEALKQLGRRITFLVSSENGRLKFGRIFSPVEMAHKETPRALYAGAISP